jgi:glycosyltransferase involved in cell wall biosynthesis
MLNPHPKALDGMLSYRLLGRLRAIRHRMRLGHRPTIALWHRFFLPPWGGGNQFLMALSQELRKNRVDVLENHSTGKIDTHLINGINFDIETFRDYASRNDPSKVVHRVNGPIHRYRGFDLEADRLCMDLNRSFATATIVQSEYTLRSFHELGFEPVDPVVIHNAADTRIFHGRGRIPFDPQRKIRLIATSWSKNPLKGGPAYKWLEEHLDWGRFEFTFVGNCSETLEKARHIPPLRPRSLAGLLRQHDIYITASAHDPCSNALIEALSSGLPAICLNSGGHPELVQGGGLPFDAPEEIPELLELIVDEYAAFQARINVPSIAEVARAYRAVLFETGS